MLSSVDRIFYPLTFYAVYLTVGVYSIISFHPLGSNYSFKVVTALCVWTVIFVNNICNVVLVGPWSVGAVIEGHVGAIFAWGIIVNGSYLPGSFTYAYGFLQVRYLIEVSI